MDPENQDRIKALVDTLGADDLVVVLGAADPEALEVAAETVTAGDPSYVGPLAGVSLGLPVVHIFEDEVKEQVDPHHLRGADRPARARPRHRLGQGNDEEIETDLRR